MLPTIRTVGLELWGLILQASRSLGSKASGLYRASLCARNVARLPFLDGQFDVYYSGGVVEHFEEGPKSALQEARRVLRPGGVFLVSVLYLSPSRRVASLFRRQDRRVVKVCESEEQQAGRRFFEYAFTSREFEWILRDEGFPVLSQQGYAILFGLYEFPLVQKVVEGLMRRRARQIRINSSGGIRSSEVARIQAGLIKRYVVSEDTSIPLVGPALRYLQWACANMQMYACLREDG